MAGIAVDVSTQAGVLGSSGFPPVAYQLKIAKDARAENEAGASGRALGAGRGPGGRHGALGAGWQR